MTVSPSLAEVIALSDMAQGGPWNVLDKNGNKWVEDQFGHPVALLVNGMETDNATFIAALVNWFRSSAASLRDEGRDTERLDWIANHGVAMRQDPMPPNHWYVLAIYHIGIPSVDDRKRYPTAREAIDAAMATQPAAQERQA